MESIISNWSDLGRRNDWTTQKLHYWRKKLKDKAPHFTDEQAWQKLINVSSRTRLKENTPEDVMEAIGRERLAVLQQQRIGKQRENETKANQLYVADDVDRFIELVGSTFYGELDRVFEEFPQTLMSKTQLEIQAECLKQKQSIRLKVRDRISAWVKDHPKKT